MPRRFQRQPARATHVAKNGEGRRLLSEQISTPAGQFDRCVRTLETTPLEKLSREYKVYAPGVGLVKDGDMQMVSHTYVRFAPNDSH
jgi:hypothetical protein